MGVTSFQAGENSLSQFKKWNDPLGADLISVAGHGIFQLDISVCRFLTDHIPVTEVPYFSHRPYFSHDIFQRRFSLQVSDRPYSSHGGSIFQSQEFQFVGFWQSIFQSRSSIFQSQTFSVCKLLTNHISVTEVPRRDNLPQLTTCTRLGHVQQWMMKCLRCWRFSDLVALFNCYCRPYDTRKSDVVVEMVEMPRKLSL